MELIHEQMKMGSQMAKPLPTQSFSTVLLGKKIHEFFIKCWSSTMHSWYCSMANCVNKLIIIHLRIRCICSEISWSILPITSANTFLSKTSLQTSFGISAIKAFFTAQSTKKVFYRPNLCRMRFWWISMIKCSIAQFSTKTTSSAHPYRTSTSRSSTLTSLVSKQVQEQAEPARPVVAALPEPVAPVVSKVRSVRILRAYSKSHSLRIRPS